jgi:hypothetical protein
VSTRTLLRVVALVAWLLAVAPIATTFGAETSAGPEQGWWNKQQAVPVQGDPSGLGLTTVPTVPAPPTVPDDGLYVAGDASGANAISALRYAVGGGGTLTLDLAEGTTLTGTEQLVACPVQGGFTPVQNGPWAAKPSYDPATCVVEGVPAEDGASFTFAVPATFASALGDVAVVIAPAEGATPFSLPFDKPGPDSFLVTAPVAPQSSMSSDSSFSPGSASFSPGVGSSSSPSFAAPSTPSASPSASSGSGSDVGTGGAPPAAVLPVAEAAGTSRSDQVVAVVVLALIGGGFWVLSNRPQRVPRLLGSVGGTVDAHEAVAAATARTTRPRGVGRFARHRSAPPTAI